MFEILLRLFCPHCDRKFSSSKIYRSAKKSAKKEVDFWEKKLIIAKCPSCGFRLKVVGKIKAEEE